MKMPKTLMIATAMLTIMAATEGRAQQPAPPRPEAAMAALAPKATMQWDQKIPMRDGVRLSANIYRPIGQSGPLPVIVTQTPYVASNYHRRGMYFAAKGFVFVVVDVRGRGNSEGAFGYYNDTPNDGADIVAWAAKQPWSDGQVALQGGSYGGTTQWLTAAAAPDRVRTMAPRASSYSGLHLPMRNGVFISQRLTWAMSIAGRTANEDISADVPYWAGVMAAQTMRHAPYRGLDKAATGAPSALFQTWLDHPSWDSYFDALLPRKADYARMTMPILSISGYYDGSEAGVLAYYKDHLKYGPPDAAKSHYLVLGPWDHTGSGTPKPEIGGLSVGSASVIDMNDLQARWYAWTMKGGEKPSFFKDRVAYFLTGANEWRFAPALESLGTQPLTYALSSTAARLTASAPGELTSGTTRGSTAAARFVYDPLDVSKLLANSPVPGAENVSSTAVEAITTDGLVYATAPMASAVDVAGSPKLDLWVSVDVPDTDLYARLYERDRSGSRILLTTDILRLRYRNSLRTPEPMPQNKPVHVVMDDFNFFARRIAEGSRIELVISAPNTLLYQRNYNSGKDVADESGADARTATISILQNGRNGSTLTLPVLPPSSRGKS